MRVLRLEGPPFEKIQCQMPSEELHELGWKGYRESRAQKSGVNPSTCMRHARWEVDGLKLCTQHAGMRVLEALAEKPRGKAQPVPGVYSEDQGRD